MIPTFFGYSTFGSSVHVSQVTLLLSGRELSAMACNDAQGISMGEDERIAGKYNPETLAKILGAMNQDGLVVLKDIIPVQTIDQLNTWMCADAERRINDPSQEYNHGIRCVYQEYLRNCLLLAGEDNC